MVGIGFELMLIIKQCSSHAVACLKQMHGGTFELHVNVSPIRPCGIRMTCGQGSTDYSIA